MGISGNFIQTILLLIALHGIFLAAIMGIGQLVADRRSHRNRLFFGLFLVFGLLTLHYLLFKIGVLHEYPIFYILGLIPFYLLGPLLYLLCLELLGRQLRGWKGFRHFIPMLLAVVDGSIALLVLHPKPMRVFSGFFYNFHIFLIAGGGAMLFALYLLRIWIIMKREFLWSGKAVRKKPEVLAVFGMLVLFTLASFTDILTIITGKILFLEISLFLVNAVVLFLFFINFRFPGFYGKLRKTVREEQRCRSYLAGLEPDVIEAKLAKVMEGERLYRLVDLQLGFVAGRIGLSPHQLSEYLNSFHMKNFQNYVNGFRIREAMRLLAESDDPVLEIAYASGFRSKSTFNHAFSEASGTTPSAYRRECRGK